MALNPMVAFLQMRLEKRLASFRSGGQGDMCHSLPTAANCASHSSDRPGVLTLPPTQSPISNNVIDLTTQKEVVPKNADSEPTQHHSSVSLANKGLVGVGRQLIDPQPHHAQGIRGGPGNFCHGNLLGLLSRPTHSDPPPRPVFSSLSEVRRRIDC